MCFRCCTTAENVVQVNGYTGQITGDFIHYLLKVATATQDVGILKLTDDLNFKMHEGA